MRHPDSLNHSASTFVKTNKEKSQHVTCDAQYPVSHLITAYTPFFKTQYQSHNVITNQFKKLLINAFSKFSKILIITLKLYKNQENNVVIEHIFVK
ncbi:hypothetical protein L596_017282 [Steinernema carpocapsae]|uniref:Uncharacterized protein n=1 Tax=Steinernema carpocapsae TaxID=34508 RepID=A0A4U5N165_STECR|nr:hypothetical protein L596_017282 [Steinernema carpocapsae]